jgi:hypothetical protein
VFLAQLAAAHAQPSGVAALATYQGPDRAQRLLDGARREGELALYTSMQMESIAPLQRAFEEKYGIKLRTWRGSGKDIRNRALTEAQAGRADLDMVESDGFALEALQREGLLQEVRSPYDQQAKRMSRGAWQPCSGCATSVLAACECVVGP